MNENILRINPKIKNNKTSKNTLILISIGILYKFLLDYAYSFPLQLNFSGYTFKYDLIYSKLIVSYVITLLQFYVIPKKKNCTSVFILIILMYIMIPMSTIYPFKNESSVLYFSTSLLFLFFEILADKIKVNNLNKTYKISIYIEYFLYFICFLIYLQLFIVKGIPTLQAFNLLDIYDFRKQQALTENKYLYYFVRYQAYTINPILIAINYLNKEKIKLFIFTILQIFLFLWLGHKAMFFILFTLYAVCLLSSYKNKQIIIASLLTFFIFFVVLIKTVFINNKSIHVIFSLFIRRALFLPAVLKYYYYEFFLENDVIGLWGTIIAPLFTAAGFRPPYYPVPVTKVIGEIYYGGSNANTGLWAAEIAHFGLAGVFVTFFCLLVFIYVIKISESRNGTRFTFIAAFTSVMGLNDGGIVNMFTISPLLFTLIFLSVYTFNYRPKKFKKKKMRYMVAHNKPTMLDVGAPWRSNY